MADRIHIIALLPQAHKTIRDTLLLIASGASTLDCFIRQGHDLHTRRGDIEFQGSGWIANSAIGTALQINLNLNPLAFFCQCSPARQSQHNVDWVPINRHVFLKGLVKLHFGFGQYCRQDLTSTIALHQAKLKGLLVEVVSLCSKKIDLHLRLVFKPADGDWKGFIGM